MNSDLKRQIIDFGRICSCYVLLAVIASCNGQKKMTTTSDDPKEEKMVLVDQNSYSGVDSTETMVIRSAKALKSFYSRINRTRKPGLPVPEIDFTKNMVVILCSSEENYTETKRISVLNETDSDIVIGMKDTKKVSVEDTKSNTDIHVNPFFVYKMPLSEKQISFEAIE